MQLIVNGTSQEVPLSRPSVSELLDHLGYDQAFLATAVNRSFVPRNRQGELVLQAGDEIEILRPMQGG